MIGIISYKDLKYWESIHKSSDFLVPTPRLRDSIEGSAPNNDWYIILLGNLRNETAALKLVLDNYQYLNRRTKDIRFFMPGFIVGDKGIVANKTTTHFDKFDFFEDGFLETVEWLEDGNDNYLYSENMEMVLLPYSKEDNQEDAIYDFDHMLFYDLDQFLQDGKNIIQFIRNAIKVVEYKMSYEGTKLQMEGIDAHLSAVSFHKVFIAGAKALEKERDSIRAAFSQLTNRSDILFQTWTYEDFDRSFTWDEQGRQGNYNEFICEEADSIIFILDDRIGGITLSEFDLAMRSFKQHGHPRIFVYCHEYSIKDITPDILAIKDLINGYGQYYTDYQDIRDLKNQVRRDFMEFTRESSKK